jgi:hypothetical protein
VSFIAFALVQLNKTNRALFVDGLELSPRRHTALNVELQRWDNLYSMDSNDPQRNLVEVLLADNDRDQASEAIAAVLVDAAPASTAITPFTPPTVQAPVSNRSCVLPPLLSNISPINIAHTSKTTKHKSRQVVSSSDDEESFSADSPDED